MPSVQKAFCKFSLLNISQIVLLFFTGNAYILGLVTCRASRGVMLFFNEKKVITICFSVKRGGKASQ